MSVEVLDSVEIECRTWSRTHKVFGVVGSLRCIELLRWFRGGALNFCEKMNRPLQTSSMAERVATATQKKKGAERGRTRRDRKRVGNEKK